MSDVHVISDEDEERATFEKQRLSGADLGGGGGGAGASGARAPPLPFI